MMFNIAVMAIVAIMMIVLLAKHGRRRRYIRGALSHKLQLGTLAAGALISTTVTDTLPEEAWFSSIKAVFSLNKWTAGADDGPIWVGIAHSDYTTAEILEWVANTQSWDTDNKIQQEVARRKIRQIGMFSTEGGDSGASNYVLNDGRQFRVKTGWMLGTGQTARFWAYNAGGSALATTDPAFRVHGHANLWPK